MRGAVRGGHYAYDPPPASGAGIPGAGTVHHVAFGSNMDEQEAWLDAVRGAGPAASGVIDRFWFRSIYFREPSGVLFEIATMGPGFTIDEEAEHLGEALILPPAFEHLREQIEPVLTPLPDPARCLGRMTIEPLRFLERPAAGAPEGALVLLHGRGADEYDLFPLLDALDPERRLLGITPRGPLSLPPGGAHWYRLGGIPTPDPGTFFPTFEAAAAFLDGLPVPIDRIVLGGFSQGAVMSWALGLGAGRPRPAAIMALSGFMPEVEGFELDLTDLDGVPDCDRARLPRPDHPGRVRPRRRRARAGAPVPISSGARPRCRTRSTRGCCRSYRRSSLLLSADGIAYGLGRPSSTEQERTRRRQRSARPLETLRSRGCERCQKTLVSGAYAVGSPPNGLTLRYLKPVSTASDTITASGPSRSARRCAPTTFAPVEIPAKIPSSLASRAVISIASSSSIGSIWSTFAGVPVRHHEARPALDQERALGAAADRGRSCRLVRLDEHAPGLERIRDAHERTRRAHAMTERGHPPFGLLPDLAPQPVAVIGNDVGVVELVGRVVPRFRRELGGAGDHVLDVLRGDLWSPLD